MTGSYIEICRLVVLAEHVLTYKFNGFDGRSVRRVDFATLIALYAGDGRE